MSRTEASFTNWNTKADGSGTTYAAGQSFTMPAENSTLYAQWDVNEYLTTLNGNGNTSGPVNLTVSAEFGSEITFPSAAETGIGRTGYVFTGWNTRPDFSGSHYYPGQIISVTETKTYYAEWLRTINITFEGPADEVIDLTCSPVSDISLGQNDTLTIQIEQNFASYQWYGDGQLLAGETNQIFDYTAEELEMVGIGVHTLTAVVETPDGQPYSKELTIQIVY